MNIETLLHEEIGRELQDLQGLEPGTEEHDARVNTLAKLVDRSIEMERLSIEHEDKIETREFENEFRLKQMEEDRKDRFVKNVLQATAIGLPLVVTVWGAVYSWKWERTDTITSGPGREFMKSILRIKK